MTTKIAGFEDRIASVKGAAVIWKQAVLMTAECPPNAPRMPADDFTDPAVAETFSHLDSAIVLRRDMAPEMALPEAGSLASGSTLPDLAVVGQRHCDPAEGLRRLIEHYRESKESISRWASRRWAPPPRRRAALGSLSGFRPGR